MFLQALLFGMGKKCRNICCSIKFYEDMSGCNTYGCCRID